MKTIKGMFRLAFGIMLRLGYWLFFIWIFVSILNLIELMIKRAVREVAVEVEED